MWVASDPEVTMTYNTPIVQSNATVTVSGKDITITPALTETFYFNTITKFDIPGGITLHVYDDLLYDRLDTNGNKVWKWADDTDYDAIYFSSGYWYIEILVYDFFG